MSEPKPEPVPPQIEWISIKPYNLSQFSDNFLTLFSII